MKKLIVLMLGLLAAKAQAQGNNPPLTFKDTPNSSVLGIKAETITPHEAAIMVTEEKAVIVDVREDNEWQQQRITGAIHIPLGQLNGRLAELSGYKETPIIAQCRSGRRSQKALTALKLAGFSKLYNLEGGIEAWNKAGFKTN